MKRRLRAPFLRVNQRGVYQHKITTWLVPSTQILNERNKIKILLRSKWVCDIISIVKGHRVAFRRCGSSGDCFLLLWRQFGILYDRSLYFALYMSFFALPWLILCLSFDLCWADLRRNFFTADPSIHSQIYFLINYAVDSCQAHCALL